MMRAGVLPGGEEVHRPEIAGIAGVERLVGNQRIERAEQHGIKTLQHPDRTRCQRRLQK